MSTSPHAKKGADAAEHAADDVGGGSSSSWGNDSRSEGASKRQTRSSEPADPRCEKKSITSPTRPSSFFLKRSMSEFQPSGGLASRNQPSQMKRKYSMVKRGYQTAVPSAYHAPRPAGDSAASEAAAATSITPHVIALVGLPARGKTYIAKKLSRYLNWIGINTRVFNLGEYRRRLRPDYQDHTLFAPGNEVGTNLREQVCDEGMKDVLRWMREGGEVAVFDATNSTRKRRKKLYDFLVEKNHCKLFFVESICDKEDIIEGNIREVKVSSPDYQHRDKDVVVEDFKKRIAHYASVYETLDENLEADFSFLKIFNAGEKVLVHKHDGHIQSRIIYYLMNVKLTKRTIYLTRHGESEFNLAGRIGGDSGLTDNGLKYSMCLSKYFESLNHKNLKVWTSWMKRTVQTTQYIPGFQERWRALNELDCGSCDGLTYSEMHDQFLEDFIARDEDKFTFRYKRGESYEDLVSRLEPVIMELERQECVLVVAHQAVIRCLLAYYIETAEEDLPWLEVPLHTVIRLEPKAYGCEAEVIKFPVDCTVTQRNRPEVPGLLEDRFVKNEPLIDKRRLISGRSAENVSELLSRLEITKIPAFTNGNDDNSSDASPQDAN